MKKIIIMIILVMLLSLTGCKNKYRQAAYFEAPKIEKTSSKTLGSKYQKLEVNDDYKKAILDFSYSTASKLLSENNVMYSPISFFYALSQLAEITAGETRQEVLKALAINDIEILRAGNENLYKKVNYDNNDSIMQIANSIWLAKDIPCTDEPLKILAEKYYSSSYGVDFNDKESKDLIEKWVSDNTGGYLGKGDFQELDPITMFILINTIYFFDEWNVAFDEANNVVKPFQGAGNVTYMNKSNASYYLDGPGYEASLLSFKNGMYISFVLPKENTSLSEFVSDPDKLKTALNTKTYYPCEVKYQIPKFNFRSSFNLGDFAKSLGIKSVFNHGDFTSLTDSPIFLTNMIQKTFIEINEKGVKAAAYTRIDGVTSIGPNKAVNFILNRPFIFAIYSSDYPIFIGVVKNPADNGEYQYR